MKKNNLKFILLTLIFFLSINCYAQISLTVNLKDSINLNPIQSGYLRLIKLDNKNALETNSDKNGKAYFKSLLEGRYILLITHVSYMTQKIEIELKNDTNLNINLSNIQLKIGEVIVYGEAAKLKKVADRYIYKLSEQESKDKSLSDLLKNLPFVVLTNSKLTVKGSTDFIILKDGRISSYNINNLESISAERVDSVELITVPSSKFDGEFSNIINVVFKKKDDFKGGNVLVRYGNRQSLLGYNYSITNDKKNVNYGINLSNEKYLNGFISNYRFYNFPLLNTIQQSSDEFKIPSFNFNYNTEYSFKNKHFLSFGIESSFQNTLSNSVFNYETDISIDSLNSKNTSNSKNLQSNFFLNYSKVYNSNSKLFISNLFNINYTDYSLKNFSINNSPTININDLTDKTFTSSVDFEKEFVDKSKIELGFKISLINYVSLPIYNQVKASSFEYNRSNYGGYISIEKKIEKILFRIGSRFEFTENSYTNGNNNSLNYLPNILISYPINELYDLSFYYTKKIFRPGLDLVNNFKDESDPLFFSNGNPVLNNEKINIIGFNNDFIFGKKNISVSLVYKKGTNLISSNRILYLDKLNVFYGNYSTSNTYELNSSFNSPIIQKKLYLNSSGSLKKYSIFGLSQTNKGIVKDVNLGLSFYPKNNISLEVITNYLANDIYLQGSFGNSLFMDFIAKYSYKKSSFLLQVTNPFSNKIKQSFNQNNESFNNSGDLLFKNRNIGISYVVRFGKRKYDESKTKKLKTDDNDTAKEKI